jgi:hypothetical protein
MTEEDQIAVCVLTDVRIQAVQIVSLPHDRANENCLGLNTDVS